MNCDCPDCRGERVYQPLRLPCKSAEQASAFCIILTGIGAPIPPYAEGDVAVIPWEGSGTFANGLADFASRANVAEPEAVRDLTCQAMAQSMGTDVENVREFADRIVDAVGTLIDTAESSSVPDIAGIMATLDEDLGDLRPKED